MFNSYLLNSRVPCSKYNILSNDALKILYYSLFHCHIVYAIEIWSLASKNLINDIFLKQKAVVRTISGSKYNSHTAPIFKTLEILPLNMLISLHLAKIMFFFKNNRLPSCFDNAWLTRLNRNIQTGGPLLRISDEYEYVVPFARTDQLRRFPIISIPEAWNDLPFEIKLSPSASSFCYNFKKYQLSTLYCPVCQALP
jgi:hypothetical protein